MKNISPEIIEARRQATITILKIIDLHRIHHRDAVDSAVGDIPRARAESGEQTCEDLAREIERRMQR